MNDRLRPPDRLRRAVAADSRPVKPLRPPSLRAAEVALWGVLLILFVPRLFGIRADALALGGLITWGAAALEATVGVLVVIQALREGVPGSGLGRGRALGVLLAGVAVQAAVAVITSMGATAMAAASGGHSGARCLAMQGSLAIPAFVITIVMLSRALPVRPAWAGALGGLGAGLLADGAWHLVCSMCDLEHLLVWHGGATVAMVVAGWLLGALWQRRQARDELRRIVAAR